ncbi:peptide chain release factor N(5)-glutamine methyltransferase [Streptococcus dentapri]|uniref:Release factor glutamine methyltransferase n=1 Tax=Streptococcus dentapri TaxID=573564 RepID=A0ABV8D085_9STRE
MTYAQIFVTYENQLAAVGEEAESLTFTFRALKNLDMTAFLLLLRQEVSPEDQALIDSIAKELLAHRPAQYIIGYEIFYNLRFKVDERVLIPRPETAELVDIILAENKQTELAVLDIGTGSGAIAISLAYHRPSWSVTASDISADALAVAAENASHYQTALKLIQSDVFSNLSAPFDIIVSNPPYIARADEDEVGLNVLASEPHQALFAEEEGLAIYQKIAQGATSHLKLNGKIYLEIGYKQGERVKALFQDQFPDRCVRILQDQFGQDRMVVVDNG